MAHRMKLDPEHEAILLRAARIVPDEARDEFFEHVSTALKHLRQITLTDVCHACAAGLELFREGTVRRHAGYG